MEEPRIQRLIPDRRQRPRGGRRWTDVEGLTPLVFVVAGETQARETCEMILAKVRFAVVPFASSEAALATMDGLRPEVVLAAETDWQRMLGAMAVGFDIPIVRLPDDAAPEAVVNAVRQALRQAAS
jgi:FixJ family two-component response regulator